MVNGMVTIGVLDLQGAVIEHVDKVNEIDGATALRVKNVEDLENIQGIILPGGESTAIGKLLVDLNIMETLKKKIVSGMPVWGTCAGMILLAKKILDCNYIHLGLMDIVVKRNAYGSQLDSFITEDVVKSVSDKKIPLVFIRAPYVESVGEEVEVLCTIDNNIVACREKNMLVTSFHPELSEDLSMHRYFYNMCK